MKTLIFSLILAAAVSSGLAQTTGSYSNGVVNPGTPGQPLYNGTNPTGQPNQSSPANGTDSYSVAIPGSTTNTSPYPSSTGTNPVNPNGTSPSYTTPYPTSPGTVGPNNFHRLYQDPMRSPKNPKQTDPVKTVDGSGGKYKSKHKVVAAKDNDFTKRKHHIRKAKAHKEHGTTPSAKSSDDNGGLTRGK